MRNLLTIPWFFLYVLPFFAFAALGRSLGHLMHILQNSPFEYVRNESLGFLLLITASNADIQCLSGKDGNEDSQTACCLQLSKEICIGFIFVSDRVFNWLRTFASGQLSPCRASSKPSFQFWKMKIWRLAVKWPEICYNASSMSLGSLSQVAGDVSFRQAKKRSDFRNELRNPTCQKYLRETDAGLQIVLLFQA